MGPEGEAGGKLPKSRIIKIKRKKKRVIRNTN